MSREKMSNGKVSRKKCPGDVMSWEKNVWVRNVQGKNVHLVYCPWNEMFRRRKIQRGEMIRGTKFLRGKMSRGKNVQGEGPHFQGAKCPWGKMSRGRNVHWQNVLTSYSSEPTCSHVICTFFHDRPCPT